MYRIYFHFAGDPIERWMDVSSAAVHTVHGALQANLHIVNIRIERNAVGGYIERVKVRWEGKLRGRYR